MLKNIKSLYFIKLIFLNYIKEKRKLKLIKYNQNFQELLKINILDYIYFSKRYIIYESNNIGKEYDFENDTLIFEGKYLNKERSGKGREYYYNKIKFEGEYLRGLRNGKGKEYINNKLIFEGQYLNGEKNGKGKEYYKNGILMFDGEYLNEKKWNGRGFDNKNNLIYELKNGKGFIKDYNHEAKLIYEGEYLNGEKSGKGKEYYSNGKIKYEGEFLNGERNGKGKEYSESGLLIFEGEYLKGKRWNGELKIFRENMITNELINGNGYIKESFNSGKIISICTYKNGLKNGKGIEFHNTPFGVYLAFEGEYLNGKRTGKGKEYSYNGKLIFRGEYLNGKRNGIGEEYCLPNSKLQFEGEYLNGYRLRGKEYIGGKLIYEGIYLLNKKWDGIGYDEEGNIIYELENGNGIIKEYELNNNILSLVFEGEYKNGRRNGKGKEYRNGILMFEGEYINGKRKR